jgi:hypothetical protein
MASGRTARRLLQFCKPTDAPAISSYTEALANQLDNDVEGGQGKLSERSAAKLRGRIYVVQGDATEANNGIVWWDTGSTWIAVNGLLDTKNVAAGKALLATGNSYGARTSRSLEAALTPSVSGPTLVTIDLNLSPTPGFGKSAKVYVNGAQITELFCGGTSVESGNRLSATFLVPPGQTWEVRDGTGTGGVNSLFSSYLAL